MLFFFFFSCHRYLWFPPKSEADNSKAALRHEKQPMAFVSAGLRSLMAEPLCVDKVVAGVVVIELASVFFFMTMTRQIFFFLLIRKLKTQVTRQARSRLFPSADPPPNQHQHLYLSGPAQSDELYPVAILLAKLHKKDSPIQFFEGESADFCSK